MSRVGTIPVVPKELRSSKSIGFQSTNPKFKKCELMKSFLGSGIWDMLCTGVRNKTQRFFSIASIESVKKPSAFVRVHFEVYKGSPPDYQAFLDTVQEYLPECGIKVVECEMIEDSDVSEK